MAATTGTRMRSSRLIISWPSRLSRSASAAVSSSRNSSMSAPATQMSFLPLSRTAEVTDESFSSRPKSASSSSFTWRLNLFTGSPGMSNVRTATPSSISVVIAYGVEISGTFHHHREAEPSRGTDGHQAELLPSSTELVEERDGDALARCAEGMADRDRAAHDVELVAIDFTHRMREARAFGPGLRFEPAKIR